MPRKGEDLSIRSLPAALANKTFVTGDQIVKATPFAHVISANKNGHYCDWCAMPPKAKAKLMKCSACQYEHYCNKVCQRKAWKVHKYECTLLKAKQPKVPVDTVRLLFKIMLNREHNFKPDIDPGWHDWDTVIAHTDYLVLDPKRGDRFKELLHTIGKYMSYKVSESMSAIFEKYEMQVLMADFGRIMFNTFTLTHLGDTIGAAVYIGPSVFNHSCAPNATFVSDGTMLYVHALESIDTSKEPIMVNYNDPLQTRILRQIELADIYYFQCECPRCSDDNLEALLNSTVCPNCEGDVVRQVGNILLCAQCNKAISSGAYRLSCIKAMHQAHVLNQQALKDMDMDMEAVHNFIKTNRVLSDKNYCLTGLKCTAYADLSQFCEGEKPYILGEELTELFKLYYPAVFPAHGLHQLKQARLAWNLQWHGKALDHYKRALSSLTLTHGKEHSIIQMVKEDIAECGQEKLMVEKFGHLLMEQK